MKQSSTLGLHETLELHELLMFKSISGTKSSTMHLLVSDPALKEILQDDADLTRRQLEELQQLVQPPATK